jgi:hypothetical protein
VLTRLHATPWEATLGGVGASARSGSLHGRACVGGTHLAACERKKRAYIGLIRLHAAPWGMHLVVQGLALCMCACTLTREAQLSRH